MQALPVAVPRVPRTLLNVFTPFGLGPRGAHIFFLSQSRKLLFVNLLYTHLGKGEALLVSIPERKRERERERERERLRERERERKEEKRTYEKREREI